MKTIICNVRLVPEGKNDRWIMIEDGKIQAIGNGEPLEQEAAIVDGQGMYLVPGFIDLHVHGGGGYSLMTGKKEDVINMCRAHLREGTTSILPTTLASSMHVLLNAIDGVKEAAKEYTDGTLLGVHLEGPFLSPEQSGAQSPDAISLPDLEKARQLIERWPGGVKMMGVAPELPGAMEVGEYLKDNGVVGSCAHTNATYADMTLAADHGYTDITHLFSCCSTIKRVQGYRVSGVIEAALEMDHWTAQFIGDLRHLPPELIRLIYKCKGAEKAYLVTDGLEFSAAELEEGVSYVQVNGMETVYEDGVMKLPHRQAFAGSVATMGKMIKNLVDHVGISFKDAVRMATETPAKVLGLTHKGKIAAGYDADVVLMDAEYQVRFVMANGKIVRNDLNV